MEAPVPASSLIHSATLVSAGLFLLLRFHVFFELSNYVYYIIPFVGALTGFYGGLCAMYQSDVKRILAYSTISHCGFLMVSFSTYLFDYTLFYLYVHGFFKAGVFLCVGNIIRFSTNYQDFRRMGGFYKYLPFECCLIAVGLFNLSGIPFSLGFYMKHLFFISLGSFYYFTLIIFILCLLGALTGLFYGFRLFYYVFFDFKKAKKITYVKTLAYNLSSYYYSNTSLASNFAIFGLFFFSYLISFYCFFLLKTTYFSSSDYMSINNIQ
jgi:NADH:ubiquinone oxidoreductase subunit 5 (subunit L)/multisubunit Na+/H+ antiporter MnhA subunit